MGAKTLGLIGLPVLLIGGLSAPQPRAAASKADPGVQPTQATHAAAVAAEDKCPPCPPCPLCPPCDECP
jgi:hypothetical protein